MLNDYEVSDTKVCTKCGEEKLLDKFFPLYGKQKASANETNKGRRAWCRVCSGKSGTEFKRNNPEARKRYSAYRRKMTIKQKYGLSEEDYFALLTAQGNGCAICGSKEGRKLTKTSKTKFGFPVDHDHDTGVTRGLLCDLCNRALGMFRDSPTLLQAAKDYLLRHGKDPSK